MQFFFLSANSILSFKIYINAEERQFWKVTAEENGCSSMQMQVQTKTYNKCKAGIQLNLRRIERKAFQPPPGPKVFLRDNEKR